MNTDTRSALARASTDVENAALLLPSENDDDTLMPGEARQLRSLITRLNDAAAQMQNMIDRADRRQRDA